MAPKQGSKPSGAPLTRQELFEKYFERASAYLYSDQFRDLLMENAPSWAIEADGGKSFRMAVISGVMTACETSKEYKLLLDCDFQSLIDAVVRIVRRGLTVGDNIAWLVPYKGIVQDQLGYMGLYNLALRFGIVTSARTQPVFENDHCEIQLGSAPGVDHKPPKAGPRGLFVGAYSLVKMPSGEVDVEWMDKAEIDKIRSMSPGQNSPAWSNWYTQMARAKVFKRQLVRIPKPISYDPRLLRDMDDIIEGHAERVDTPALAAPTEKPMDTLGEFVREQRRDREKVPVSTTSAEDLDDDATGSTGWAGSASDDAKPRTEPSQSTLLDEDNDGPDAVSLIMPGSKGPELIAIREACGRLVREAGRQDRDHGVNWIRAALKNNPWLEDTPTKGVLETMLERLEQAS